MLTRVVVFRYCVYQNFSSFHSTRSFSLFETIHEKMRKIVATIESWRTEEERGRERRTVWRRIHEKSRTWNPVYRVVDTRVFKWWRGTLTFFFSTLAPRWSLRYEWTLIKGHRERGSLRAHGNLSCLAPFSYPLLALRKKLGRYKFDSTTLQWNAKKKGSKYLLTFQNIRIFWSI